MFANDHIHIFVTARRRRKKLGFFFEGVQMAIYIFVTARRRRKKIGGFLGGKWPYTDLCNSPPQAKKNWRFLGKANGHIHIFVTARRRRKKVGGGGSFGMLAKQILGLSFYMLAKQHLT